MPVKPIPDGYAGMQPYLAVDGAAKAIEFYQNAFGATVVMRLDMPDGKIGHAEIKIGQAILMLADPPGGRFKSPTDLGGTSVGLHFYVEDVDATFARAVAAGATVERPVQDQFYGDRSGGLIDPFGHVWWFATHKEDLTPEEIGQRAAAMHG